MNQEQMILRFMREHGDISSMDAFQHLGITRLPARIFDLRQHGHHIACRDVEGLNRFGEPIRYRVYWLLEDEND